MVTKMVKGLKGKTSKECLRSLACSAWRRLKDDLIADYSFVKGCSGEEVLISSPW